MIACPKCQSSLPDWAQACQFCGTDVKRVARPVVAAKPQYYAYGTAKWVWVAYYVISSWFVATGLFGLARAVIGLIRFNQSMPTEFQALNFVFYFSMFFAGAAIAVGVGLLLQSDFIRGIANYYCALMAVFGIYSVMSYMTMGAILGSVATWLTIRSALDVVLGLMMIYLILETNASSI